MFDIENIQNRTVEAKPISNFVVGDSHNCIVRDKVLNIHGSPFIACSNQTGRNVKIFTPGGDIGTVT